MFECALRKILWARCGTYTYNPSTQEAEAGGIGVLGQPELHSETLCKKSKGWVCSLVQVACIKPWV
jgi:hypothetical protein